MDPRGVVRRSKRLSHLLRHAPGSAGLTLDAAGWVDVDALLTVLGWTRPHDERDHEAYQALGRHVVDQARG